MDHERLAYIDGLRGLAVGMVVLYHVWIRGAALWPSLHRPAYSDLNVLMDSLGQCGVGLFLVLSGFCLSLSIWSRWTAGSRDWLVPSRFLARRCLRILPPYYAALAICVALEILFRTGTMSGMFGSPPGVTSVLTHALLVHNLTSDAMQINAPFWSLGLEWQWYWVFPFVMLFCVRSWRLALLASAGLAMAWLFLVSFLHVFQPALVPSVWLWFEPQTLLMARLFEFTSGVVVARMVTRPFVLPRLLRGPGALLILPFTLMYWQWLSTVHLEQIGSAIGFSLLIVASHREGFLHSTFSLRPLAWLGTISYSVYLIHAPAVQAAEWVAHALGSPAWVSMLAGAGFGVAAGWIFHLAFERPCLKRTTWLRVSPYLVRLLRWTDRVYPVPAEAPEVDPVPAGLAV